MTLHSRYKFYIVDTQKGIVLTTFENINDTAAVKPPVLIETYQIQPDGFKYIKTYSFNVESYGKDPWSTFESTRTFVLYLHDKFIHSQ
ncbi:MAG: hypothetical protein ABI778_12415 [Ignavibacteriota bacterium]